MIIVPTRICNTDTCNYCWVYKKDFEVNYFKDFLVEDFFEKLELISEKTWDYDLRFFWWEPMLKFSVIKKIISYIQTKSNKYHFIINTNLTLIDEEKIKFIQENNIKLIISCNWKLKTHSKMRGISIKQTLHLYKNIKLITSHNIDHQINIVVDNESAREVVENIDFIEKYLWAKHVNLLPVNYNWWTNEGLKSLEESFKNLTKKMNNKEISIHFINKDIRNDVPLFNSEFVIDSDGNVYPNMVILETFFAEEKKKILITHLSKTKENIQKDLHFYDDEYNEIYSQYINNFLLRNFKDIIKNDYQSSEIFHNFLNTI